jgi:hypothetical protein
MFGEGRIIRVGERGSAGQILFGQQQSLQDII